jgi:hypothetical protein
MELFLDAYNVHILGCGADWSCRPGCPPQLPVSSGSGTGSLEKVKDKYTFNHKVHKYLEVP